MTAPEQDARQATGLARARLFRGLRALWLEAFGMSFFLSLLALAVPLFVLQVYDRVVQHAGLSTLAALTAGALLALGFDFILRQGCSRLMQRSAVVLEADIAGRLIDKLLVLPLASLEARSAAQWQVAFRDVETLRNGFAGGAVLVLLDLPFILVFFALAATIAQPIAWVYLALLAVLLLLAGGGALGIGKATGAERLAFEERDQLLHEILTARATVKALDLGASLRPRWRAREAEAVRAAVTRGRLADSYVNGAQSVGLLTIVLLTSVGALAIVDQRMSIGALVAANLLGGRFVAPLLQLVGTWRALAAARLARRRLETLLALPEERARSTVALPRPAGRLQLENVSFRYGAGLAPVLNGLTLRLGPAGLHAVVGRNGSGKSTLLKLMQGLYSPAEGRVLLDGADLAQFARADLARWIGYVPQDCVLFAGCIRDNIAAASPRASDEEVLRAAELAGVHGFAIDLPGGYGSEIGEAGARLSAGQRRRVAIARALLRDPPVLLLDEPTADLDRQAEEELRERLVELKRDHTIVIATHSPPLLAAADSVMALQAGRIVLAGRSEDVLRRLYGEKTAGTAAV